MADRSPLHRISQGLLKIALYVALLGVVVFFALTRTQVGRNELRQRLQHQFNQTFAGTLQIGHLEGNLVNDLFASDIRILDTQGRPLLTVDSVVARPRWNALFNRQVSLRSVTLIQPSIELRRRADSSWNIEHVFDRPPPQRSQPPSFTLADLHIQNGTITTQNAGASPDLVSRRWLFDYAQTRVEGVQAHLTIEWNAEGSLIDIFDLSGHVPDLNLSLNRLQGQVLVDPNRWALNQASVYLGSTALTFDAAYEQPESGASSVSSAPYVSVDLSPSQVSFVELRRIVPRLPLSDTVTVEGQIRGPLSGLTFESLAVERGRSRVQGQGTIRGLPDVANVEVNLTDSRLAASDVRALLPETKLPDFDHLGVVQIEDLHATGLAPLSPETDTLETRLSSTLALRGQAGALRGTIDVSDAPHRSLRYGTHLRVDSLDLGSIFQSATYRSRLNGRLSISGQGTARDSLQADLDAALSSSMLDGQSIDSLRAVVHARRGHYNGTLSLRSSPDRTMQLQGTLNLATRTPSYRFSAETRRLDLAALPFLNTPTTDLTTRFTAEGNGFRPAVLSGQATLHVDTSYVADGDQLRLIPPHQSTLTLQPRGASGPRVQLDGDVAALRLDGDVAFKPLWALGHLWGGTFASAARKAWDKPFPRALAAATPEAAALTRRPRPDPPQPARDWRKAARSALEQSGYGAGLTVRGDFHLYRSDILYALLPTLPAARTDLSGELEFTASADHLTLQGTMAGDRLQHRTIQATRFEANFTTTADLDAPLRETLQADVILQSDSARIASIPFRAPHLKLRFQDRTSFIEFNSEAREKTGPFQLTARLDLLADRNELTVYNLLLTAGHYRWQNIRQSTLRAYSNALVIPDLTLESPLLGTSHIQRLHMHGTLSSAPTDTTHVVAENVLLRPLSDLLDQKRPIGGLLNGDIALTGRLDQPKLTSTLDVSWLSIGSRLLGHLTATSRYRAGTPELLVEAGLHPEVDSIAARPDYFPTTLRRIEPSRLQVGGTIYLPEHDAASPAAARRAPTFDLDVAIERADLFFFDYIFEEHVANVSGYATGTGTIRGSFTDPLFNADLQVVDGALDLPRFNLSYTLAGPVRVDREGIKLDGVDVSSSEDGRATLNGAILFNEYRYFSFDLSATLDELQIIDVEQSQDLPFYGTIWASGRVTLTGPLPDATLRSLNGRTTPDSELFIPVSEDDVTDDSGFIIFADSTGQFPNLKDITQRDNVLADRPAGEPSFLDGLELDLNVTAPEGSTVHLVFDPLLGDVVTAVGSGRVQIQRQEGEFFTYGTLEVTSGEYLFTAGEVFVRRFSIDQGTITWDGDPTNAQLDLDASYRTRASTAGLPAGFDQRGRIPVVVQLDITGRVESPRVDLSLALDRRDQAATFYNETLDAVFNQPGLATEYATSVLLTNTFLLTTTAASEASSSRSDSGNRLASAGNQLAFNSVSQLVASQLNRYLSKAVPNLDVNLGVQGEDPQNLDLIYGVALRLLDERLIIRGQGVYPSDEEQRRRTEGLEGEFIVEVRLNRNVSVEVFYRRAGNELLNDQTLTSTTGAGLSYQTQFANWRQLFRRLFGWLFPGDDEPEEDTPSDPAITAEDPE